MKIDQASKAKLKKKGTNYGDIMVMINKVYSYTAKM
jgi:hypothetical protein